MTILWCGSEQADFEIAGTFSYITNTDYFRSSVARCSYLVSEFSRITSPPVTPFTSAWLSFRFVQTSFQGSASPYPGVGFYNSSNGAFIGICNGSVTGKVAIGTYQGGSAGTRLAQENGLSMSTSLLKVDIQLSNYGSNGTINIFINGNLVVSYTGDLTVNGATNLDQMCFICTSTVFFRGYISELILADEDTRGMSLHTLTPNASGDTNDWTNDYDSLNDIRINEFSVIHTDTMEDDFQCNLSDMTDGDFDIKAVKVSAKASDGLGSKGIQVGIKTNSDIDLSSVQNLSSAWETKSNIWSINPITSQPFTVAEINALQGMIRAKTAI